MSNDPDLAPQDYTCADVNRILRIPLIEQAELLLRDCSLTASIGVIVGPNGCGKSEALKRLAGNYRSLGLPGQAARIRCCQQDGPTRGAKDILLEIGVGGALMMNGQATPLSLICKTAVRAFRQRNLRCLLLDEADNWTIDTLGGFVTLLDYLRDKDHPVCAILTGVQSPTSWIGAVPALDSRTLATVNGYQLSENQVAGVLCKWGGAFSGLADSYIKGEGAALNAMQTIQSATGGNLRRLNYLCSLLAASKSKSIGKDEVISVLARMAK